MMRTNDYPGDGFKAIAWILEHTSLWDTAGFVSFEVGNHLCNVHLDYKDYVAYEFWDCGIRTCAVHVPVDYLKETTVGYYFNERGKGQLDFLFAKGGYLSEMASTMRIEDWTGREEDFYNVTWSGTKQNETNNNETKKEENEMELKEGIKRIENEWTAICERITRLLDEAKGLIAKGGEREVLFAYPIEELEIRGWHDYTVYGFGYDAVDGVYVLYDDHRSCKDFIGHYLIEDQLEICLALLRVMDEMGDEM